MLLREDTLTIRTAELDDIEDLDWIYEEACDYFKGDTSSDILTPLDCMKGLDIPRGGKRENYELLSFVVGEMIIGYMAVYRDYPRKDWVQIPFLYIAERARAKGFGERIIKLIKRYFRESGYRTLRALCSLKNVGGIKFLYSHGFETVICISENEKRSYAGIGLECDLGRRHNDRY